MISEKERGGERERETEGQSEGEGEREEGEREPHPRVSNPPGITPWIRSPRQAELDKERRKLEHDCESLKVSCLFLSLARSLSPILAFAPHGLHAVHMPSVCVCVCVRARDQSQEASDASRKLTSQADVSSSQSAHRVAGEYHCLASDYNAALDRLEEIETRVTEIARKIAEQSPGPSAAAGASGGGGAAAGRGRVDSAAAAGVDSESDSGASASAGAGADGANSARRGSRRLLEGAAGSQGVAPAVRPRSEESARGDEQSKRPRNGVRV